MNRKILLFFIVFCSLSAIKAYVSEEKDMKVILFLIGGYRWTYTNDPFLTGIPELIKNGVQASYVTPVYPASSYANLYSIVTGLYSENHGFVGNQMYDQGSDKFFLVRRDNSMTDPFWWNEAEPIWVTAEKNGKRSALYWWPGCDVEIRGKRPTICVKYSYGPSTERMKNDILLKVDEALHMFKRNELSLAQVYYGSMDDSGHHSGPNSPARNQDLYLIDDVLEKVQKQIKKMDLEDEVNIMVVADHGMSESNEGTNLINLNPYYKRIKYQITYGSSSMILPKPGMLDKLYAELKHSLSKGMKIYKKEQIPEHYHFKNSSRILPLLLQAKKGYQIKLLGSIGDEGNEIEPGVHGYDPFEVEDMRTVFFARGPAFKVGFVSDPLSNVDHYNLMCHILGMTPLPNNGSWEKVKTMLRKQRYSAVSSSSVAVENSTYVIALVCSMVIYSVFT